MKSIGLSDFLLEYPPQIYLGNGGVVINGEIYQSKQTLTALPEDCFIKDIDWNGCDIKIEFEAKGRLPQKGKQTVHQWLEKYLTNNFSEKSLILKDHATGEIADFVLIEPEHKKISLYHCKSAKKYTPSATISDLVVLEQVLRSINWIRKGDIISEIIKRGCDKSYRPNSHLVKGTKPKLVNVATKFHANEWHYRVIIVQPGLDCKKATNQKNTNTLLLNCYEWLSNQGAQFQIMGNS